MGGRSGRPLFGRLTPWRYVLLAYWEKRERDVKKSTRQGRGRPELTWQELRSLIVACVTFEREEWCRCSYTCNPQSLYQMQYNCIFFVARRPPRQPANGSEP